MWSVRVDVGPRTVMATGSGRRELARSAVDQIRRSICRSLPVGWSGGGGPVRRSGRTAVLGVVVATTLLAGVAQAGAAPPPPKNPNDAALAQSRQAVTARAAQVSTLTGQLAALDAKT